MHLKIPESKFDTVQKKYFTEHLNSRNYRHPVVALFSRQRVEFTQKKLGCRLFDRVLEVGCGDGFGTYYMRGVAKRFFGCDLSESMLRSNPLGTGNLACSNAYRLPYKDSAFDFVFCWELLHHLADPQRAVNEMARVAKDYILFFEPNRNNPAMFLFGAFNVVESGLLRFSPDYLSRLAQNADLLVQSSDTVGNFTPNRTPSRLAQCLSRLPFEIPIFGLYTVLIARKRKPAP